MGEAQVILMPGLDGTGDLFAPLLCVMPASVPRRVLWYPTDRAMGYEELLLHVEGELAGGRPLVLVAESFSGPLALRYAAAHPERVRAVILCASFVSSPVPRWIGFLVRPGLFHLPLPSMGIRMLLAGWKSPVSLVEAVKNAIARVRPAVLARRVREVLGVDCGDALAGCSAPILYLRGEQDALVRKRSAERIASTRADVVVRTIRGPHLLLQASAAEAWGEIEAFLRSL